jgi:hypothetical protein
VIAPGVVATSSGGWNRLFIVNRRTCEPVIPDERRGSAMPDGDNRADMPKAREPFESCRSPNFYGGRVQGLVPARVDDRIRTGAPRHQRTIRRPQRQFGVSLANVQNDGASVAHVRPLFYLVIDYY